MKKVGFAAAGAISALVLLAGCCNTCGRGGGAGAPGYGAPAGVPVYQEGSSSYNSSPTYAPVAPSSGAVMGPPAGSGSR